MFGIVGATASLEGARSRSQGRWPRERRQAAPRPLPRRRLPAVTEHDDDGVNVMPVHMWILFTATLAIAAGLVGFGCYLIGYVVIKLRGGGVVVFSKEGLKISGYIAGGALCLMVGAYLLLSLQDFREVGYDSGQGSLLGTGVSTVVLASQEPRERTDPEITGWAFVGPENEKDRWRFGATTSDATPEIRPNAVLRARQPLPLRERYLGSFHGTWVGDLIKFVVPEPRVLNTIESGDCVVVMESDPVVSGFDALWIEVTTTPCVDRTTLRPNEPQQ